jgi:hypothetical protein
MPISPSQLHRRRIINLSGCAESGKSTAAKYLVEKHNFTRQSYAANLKKITAIVFGFNLDMLTSVGPAATEYKNTPNLTWSTILGREVTPRYAMQYVGTELFREHLHTDIWVHSAIAEIKNTNADIVFDDCRFPNEDSIIRAYCESENIEYISMRVVACTSVLNTDVCEAKVGPHRAKALTHLKQNISKSYPITLLKTHSTHSFIKK